MAGEIIMAAWPLNKIHRGKTVLFICVVIVTVWLAYPYFVESYAPVQPKPAVVRPLAAVDSRPVMPRGFGQPSTIYDPFRMQQAVLPLAAAPNQETTVATTPYRVTGIAIGNSTAVVILESNAGSRSYRIGEYVGQYQIREITQDSVLIVAPNESHLLSLKRGI